MTATKHPIIGETNVTTDPAVQALRGHLGHPGHPARRDHGDLQGLQDSHRFPGLRDQRDLEDQLGPAEGEEPQVLSETQGRQDRWAQQDPQGRWDQLDRKGREATVAQEGDKDRRDGRGHLPI
ncbi:hypothetical protein NKR19_g6509 [Coniochaeta hoffmannii]|uniref:Uncharacterized protein n=1 Tax=Coniochaeta hoffmannii TaxID=91930 RepID=A0AA38RE21_9PEZI|nr:hypothetical protein NKR19_g6509 [Coniochaeta hoffmannii]